MVSPSPFGFVRLAREYVHNFLAQTLLHIVCAPIDNMPSVCAVLLLQITATLTLFLPGGQVSSARKGSFIDELSQADRPLWSRHCSHKEKSSVLSGTISQRTPIPSIISWSEYSDSFLR